MLNEDVLEYRLMIYISASLTNDDIFSYLIKKTESGGATHSSRPGMGPFPP